MTLQILVADDDLTIRTLIKECLELENYSVILADNGRQALNLAQQYHPHLLISDIKMPHKDGYDLVKELRQIPQFRLLPVIFLTNSDNPEARITGYQAGCDVYLAKPFHSEELLTIIRHLLERSQMVQSELSWTKTNNSQVLTSVATSPLTEINLQLTRREKEILKLIIQGLSNPKIGEKLYLSPKTVEKYVSSLLKKTGVHNRTELVSFAFQHKIV
jgi:DNA-binding NarL/FixJ family response regulator